MAPGAKPSWTRKLLEDEALLCKKARGQGAVASARFCALIAACFRCHFFLYSSALLHSL